MCTSLIYRDSSDGVYFGRTLELSMELPYQLGYFPVGQPFSSVVEGHPAMEYQGLYRFLAITMPDRAPAADRPLLTNDFKVLEGVNEQGLTFSLLAYPATGCPRTAARVTQSILSASDLGAWLLSQFGSVAAVKNALAKQTVSVVKLAMLGGVASPFHYVVHDSGGAAIVIEFSGGEATVYDNPVGVMTNGPAFPWHLTNLDNYTFLNNRDQSRATFGSYQAHQPDSGIATASLPSSNTSVGRFVRAVYYAQFAERASDPDTAVQTLAHIMNNFDRPRGITVAVPDGEAGLNLEAMGSGDEETTTEYTSWTSMADLQRKQLYIRTYRSLGYVQFALAGLSDIREPVIFPMSRLSGLVGDQTPLLLAR